MDDTRQRMKVVLFDGTRTFQNNPDFIDWISALVAGIPRPYLDTIECEATGTRIKLWYFRPETYSEKQERLTSGGGMETQKKQPARFDPLIPVDLTILLGSGGEGFLGLGIAHGENRARIAVEKAMVSLTGHVLEHAVAVVVTIIAGLKQHLQEANIGCFEVNEVMEELLNAIPPDADCNFGVVIDPALGDELRVIVIADCGRKEKSLP